MMSRSPGSTPGTGTPPSSRQTGLRRATFALVFFATTLCLSTRAETYLVTDLGTLGGAASQANAINNAGLVAGFALDLAANSRAVVLSNSFLIDLGTLGGSNSVAHDISDSGLVAGWANPANSTNQHAALFRGTNTTDIGALVPQSVASVGLGVNSLGTVVGEYRTARGFHFPLVYANGILPLDFQGVATCVNDAGQIGGYEFNDGKLGFIISGGIRQDVGSLGSNDTVVAHLNGSGMAVGVSLTRSGTYHAFGYEQGIMRDLGTLGGGSSAAYGINNRGHIVGQSEDSQGAKRAFIYRKNVIIDLNTFLPPGSDWFLTAAYGINDTGQIVGVGTLHGQSHGFLLTPNFLDIALFPGLTVVGKVGRTYRIDYLDSVNPTNTWQALTNFVLNANPTFVIDPRPVVFSNRIYRSVLLP